MSLQRVLGPCGVFGAMAAAGAALAQTPPEAPPAPTAPTAAPSPPPEPTRKLAPVEITGTRANDMQERRQSTAAKIVIGREEIDAFGDSTLGEVLKRLPGISIQGAPGRGGNIRMRGLSGGYTQILLDGERMPPGFSIDSLLPEQIERIEILRAPTAETGARAIGGTINIVTREGFRKKLDNARIGTGFENGKFQPSASLTRNDSVDDLIYNYTVSAFRNDRESESTTTTLREQLAPPGGSTLRTEAGTTNEQRTGMQANGRLQWRGERGNSVVLMPMFIYSQTDSLVRTRVTQDGGVAPYDSSTTTGDSAFSLLRLNGQWNRQLDGAGRVELKGGFGQSRNDGRSVRLVLKDDGSTPLPPARNLDDNYTTRGQSGSLSTKYTTLLASKHSFVSGAEVETNTSDEHHTDSEEGDDFSSSVLRFAAYAQDEWNVTPQWALHAGLRWEGIRTRSDTGLAGTAVSSSSNRSSVWTPLFHTVWRPEPNSRDQVRLSLTRSYRSPTVQNLIGRTRLSSDNSETRPDRAGNPDLKPELATGVDVAVERYITGSGILSANVFYRRITDYMRGVTALEGGRFVSRMRNVGDASTQGIELEAKFRLSDLMAAAPPVDFRANASIFRSRVRDVPGPDNRLDQQPGGTLNLGADYRFRGTPVAVGGNINWTPGYDTRISSTQWLEQGRKLVGDAFVLYTFNPAVQLRLSAANFAPADYTTGSRFESASARETAQTVAASYINWALRLELKL